MDDTDPEILNSRSYRPIYQIPENLAIPPAIHFSLICRGELLFNLMNSMCEYIYSNIF